MVSPSATAIETEKNGIPRLALSDPSIGSTTMRKGPSLSRMPTSSETIVAPSTAREPLKDHALGGGVDRSRLVSSLAVADDRLPLDAGGQLDEDAANVLDRLAAEREPVGHNGTEAPLAVPSSGRAGCARASV